MTLTRLRAAWAQGAILALALALMVALSVADRQRGDWVAGPVVLLVYLAALPIHLGALMAAWKGEASGVRAGAVILGGITLVAQLVLFVAYLRGGSA